jgi:outer membrane protein insertion porin family
MILNKFLSGFVLRLVPVIAMAVLPHSSAYASGRIIESMLIQGNERIELETISSYLKLKQRGDYSEAAANESIKRLYATGLFSEVAIEYEAGNVLIKITENPIVSTVAFEGNKRIEDEDLEKEVQTTARGIFSRSQVQQDVLNIQSLYRRSGRFLTKVEPKLIDRGSSRVDLVFEVDEGPLTKVKEIYFVGNREFSDNQLKSELQTSESRWYRFFSDDDKYDPDRINFDKELLRRYYTENGFADFRVISAVAEITPEKDAFFVTYTMQEGERYDFGDLKITSRIPELSSKELQGLLLASKGDEYNSKLVEDTVDGIIEELGNRGFAFVDVEPVLDRDKTKKVVNVEFTIGEGPKVYVERINIKGNVRTLDKVIRREFRLSEGDPYSVSRLKRSEQRINNLGFFEKVEIETRQGSAPDRAIIDVSLSERSTGELNIGAGYSSLDGLLTDIGVRENNLLGKGQVLNLRTTLATRRQEIDLGFTEPYFLDRELAAGFDVFKTRQDFRSQSSYDRESTGFVLRTEYPLTENLDHSVRYSLRTDDITNIDAFASRYIRDQEGKTTTSLVGQSFIFDGRDNKFDPSEGGYLRFNQDLGGLGGDVSFLRNELIGSYYYPLFANLLGEGWVFRASSSAGHITGLKDDDVLIKDRFFVGGTTLRGFDQGGIGPRDSSTKDALGGNIYYTATAEQTFPLGLPEELGILGSAFVDAGNLWSIDESGPEVTDADIIRASTGVGVYWRSPFGPIRVDYAVPFRKDELDDIERINFSFGTRF